MYFDGPYGVYHSQYDNYFRQSTIVDPGFRIGVGLSRLWGTLAWRLAEIPVLPMRYSDYAQAAVGYIEAAEKHAGSDKPVKLAAARAAAAGCGEQRRASSRAVSRKARFHPRRRARSTNG